MNESETEMQAGQNVGVEGAELLSILGKAHTLSVLREICFRDNQRVRFGELQDALDLSPNTLSRRLDELIEAGFLKRTQYNEIPPRVEYEAMEPLAELEPTFRELENWLQQYGADQLDCPE